MAAALTRMETQHIAILVWVTSQSLAIDSRAASGSMRLARRNRAESTTDCAARSSGRVLVATCHRRAPANAKDLRRAARDGGARDNTHVRSVRSAECISMCNIDVQQMCRDGVCICVPRG